MSVGRQTLKSTIAIDADREVLPSPELVRVLKNLSDRVDERLSVAQAETPATGATVQMVSDARDGFLRVQGGGALAALAIAHPSDADSVDGQVRRVHFDVAVTALTWPGSSDPALPASAAAGDSVTTQRLEAGLWKKT